MAALRRGSALASRFPGVAQLPITQIAELPTPVLRIIGDVPEGLGGLWVKRDDLSADRYGGNKVRKLEYLLGAAPREGRRAAITFGAVGSNHVLATATYASAMGLEVHAILTPQAPTPFLPVNVRADLAAGAVLHPVRDVEEAKRLAVTIRAELLERDGVEPLVIPMGGTSPLGVLGFVNAALELASQVELRRLPEPDVAYVALGSMGTCVGLAIGFAAVGMKTEVVGVRVTPESIANEALLVTLLDETVASLRGVDPAFPILARADVRLDLRQGFFGDGYAVPTAECRAALDVAARWGLLLETTYTGKALAALLSDANAGVLLGKDVLFWNTYNSRPLSPPAVSPADIPEGIRGYFEEGDSA